VSKSKPALKNPSGNQPIPTSRLILGMQPVREALRAHGSKVEQVMIESSNTPQLRGLQQFARDLKVNVRVVPRAELDRISAGTRHQGTAALVPALVLHDLESLLEQEFPLLVALDQIQDPQNFGAVVRNAVALAGAAVMWPESSSAPLTPTTFRASAGAIEHAKLVKVPSLRKALQQCREAAYHVVVLDSHAELSLDEVDLRNPTVLVIGSEGSGVRKSIRREATVRARIPMAFKIDSINASAATAVALYEVIRQRRKAGMVTSIGPTPSAAGDSDESSESDESGGQEPDDGHDESSEDDS
jgi:23S rRNA (guanosine2251-2'-O)-methyltransferase